MALGHSGWVGAHTVETVGRPVQTNTRRVQPQRRHGATQPTYLRSIGVDFGLALQSLLANVHEVRACVASAVGTGSTRDRLLLLASCTGRGGERGGEGRGGKGGEGRDTLIPEKVQQSHLWVGVLLDHLREGGGTGFRPSSACLVARRTLEPLTKKTSSLRAPRVHSIAQTVRRQRSKPSQSSVKN